MVSMQIAALVIALSNPGETVLLDFSAPWCAPCRMMDSTVAQLEQAGYPVRNVNIDRERQLAAQYQVQSIPCFVLLVQGKEAGRLIGAVRKDELVGLFSKAGYQPGNRGGMIARGQSPDPPVQSVSVPGVTDRNPLTRSRVGEVSPTAVPAHVTPTSASVSAQDMIAASVRLTITDDRGFSYGSGTIIDARQGEALVLTCGHIFRDSQGKGQISVDLCAPGGPQKLPGRLVNYDDKNDIGLVSIRPGVPVRVAPVASPGTVVNKGDRVITVGCNNGGPATADDTKITSIDKFLGPPNFQVAGLPVQGRSGGGLFTGDGRVIGVCNAADPADNEGLYAALLTIHQQLDKAGLTALYQNTPTPTALAGAAGASAGMQPQARPDFSAQTASVAGLSPQERAALAAVAQQGETAEVICIVRPLSDPKASSEVIKLDRASAAFLQQLAADRQAQEARHLTSLEVRSASAKGRAPLRTSTAEGVAGRTLR